MTDKEDDLVSWFNRSKLTVKQDKFDEYTYKSLCEDNERLETIEKEHKELETVPPLITDIFDAFYKYVPKQLPDEEIDDTHIINKEVISKMMKSEEYAKARLITRMDDINSLAATLSFAESIIEELKKENPNLENHQNKINQLKKNIADQQNQMGQAKSKEEKSEIQKNIEKMKAESQKLGKKPQISQSAVSNMLKKAKEKADEMNEAMQGAGWGSGEGSLRPVSPKERMKLARLMLKNNKVLLLMKELGRMQRLASSTYRNKVKETTSELYDITQGNDLSKIVPSEILALRYARSDFLKRFSEGQLLQYELRDREKKIRGDMIVCLDLSGSMSGDKEAWAKAVALACLTVAAKENRGYTLITFDDSVRSVHKFDKKNKPTIDDVIKIAETDYGGGTDFEKPLAEAIKHVDKKSDILFITDGEADVSDKFLSKFEKKRSTLMMKVIAVQIGEGRIEPLTKFSDKVIELTTFLETSKEIFEAV